MNRFRALLLVAVAVGLTSPAVRAATIEVTTASDIVADNDNLCSIREAILTSARADELRVRSSARQQIVGDQETLEGQLPRLQTRPEETFSRTTLLTMMTVLRDEVQDHLVPDVALLADINVLINELNPPPPAPLPPNPNLDEVERAIALQERTIVRLDAEVTRLKGEDEIDGCINGSAFDVISLAENITYSITLGTIAIDRRTTIRGAGPSSVITPAAGLRAFSLLESASLDLSKLSIAGADLRPAGGAAACDPASSADDGAALLVNGTLTVQEVTFRDNHACDGGALSVLAKGSVNFTTVKLLGNTALGNGGAIASVGGLSLSDVTFGSDTAGNTAGGNGGAIFLHPLAESVGLTIDRGSFINNRAVRGSALHVAGLNTTATLTNVTIARNVASGRAAVNIETTGAGVARVYFNNISMLENEAPAPATGGLHIATIGGQGVALTNSLLADNDNLDCDFGSVSPAVEPNFFSRNYYGQAGGCPGGFIGFTAPEYANFRLLAGQAAIGYLVSPLVAGADHYLPIYPDEAIDPTPRLVNRGASTQDPNRCADRDQRNKERASFADIDCDIGAVEYQVGRRLDDVIAVKVDEISCLDVVANDIGDAGYVPGTLTVLMVERAGALARVLRRSVDPDGAGPLVDEIGLCPNAVAINAADPLGQRDVILFTPPARFQGETVVTYAFTWATPDPVSTGDVSGFARVVTESRGGISSSSVGGNGLYFLLALLILGWRRMRAGKALLAVLAMAALPAQANENIIRVTSGQDPFDTATSAPRLLPGDGLCTLREALNTARNDQANLTGGDCVNGNEGPDVVQFFPNEADPGYVQNAGVNADGHTLKRLVVSVSTSLTAFGGVTLRCPEPDEIRNSAGDVIETIAYECIIRPVVTTRRFSLINSEGSISLVRMILENGNAGTGNGGALNSRGGVFVANSILRNNSARTGGAIFLRGVRSDLNIVDSLFEDNSSTGSGSLDGGGAVATTADDEHRVQVSSSAFIGNQSASSAAALSLKTLRPVILVNSTFSGNTSSAGAGAIDVGGAAGSVTLRNLTIIDNRSGAGFSAVEAPGRSVVLTNSILAANFDLTLADANCGAGLFNSTFNLVGETVNTCPLDSTQPKVSPEAVFDFQGDGTPQPWLGPLRSDAGPTPLHVPDRTATRIIDAGYNIGVDGNLVEPLDTGSPKCANVDQRGVSRESGGRCDIGAYEYQRITAVNDSGNNIGRLDRKVIIDLLANDLFAPEDSEKAKTDCDLANPDLSTPDQVRLVDAAGSPCLVLYLDGVLTQADIQFVKPDDATVFTTPLSTDSAYVLRFLNNSTSLLPYGQLIDAQTPKILRYEVYTKGIPPAPGVASAPAQVSISVENIPPFVFPDKLIAEVGKTVVIDVLANDVEHDGTLNPATVTITGSTCREVADIQDFDGDGNVTELYWQCQFGRATIDPATGRITWVPTNRFNPFTETFSYTVQDSESEPKEGTATVTIVMDVPKTNGGGLFGEDDLSDILGIDFLGGLGLGSLGLSALLALRRRPRI